MSCYLRDTEMIQKIKQSLQAFLQEYLEYMQDRDRRLKTIARAETVPISQELTLKIIDALTNFQTNLDASEAFNENDAVNLLGKIAKFLSRETNLSSLAVVASDNTAHRKMKTNAMDLQKKANTLAENLCNIMNFEKPSEHFTPTKNHTSKYLNRAILFQTTLSAWRNGHTEVALDLLYHLYKLNKTSPLESPPQETAPYYWPCSLL